MVIERQITVYDCSFCEKTYSKKEDAERCETSCAKLAGSPDISILDLTSRTYNILKIAGIDTVQEVLEKTDIDLLKLKGFGEWCLHDLQKQLQPFGSLNPGTDESKGPLGNARPQKFHNSDRTLPEFLENQITQFVDHQDWVRLYKDYQWQTDTWEQGFPDILRLEMQLRCSIQKGEIKKQDILDVANWGKLSSPSRITSPESISLSKEFLHDGIPLLQALTTLEQNIRGLGVTYLSEILRFSFPNQAGALDSRMVQVFGIGDPSVNQYQWLTIRARKSGSGWYVYRNRMWHMEYEKWLSILSKMVTLINTKEIPCPHPQNFLDVGLRTEDIWTSADVGMAIFSYVTNAIKLG